MPGQCWPVGIRCSPTLCRPTQCNAQQCYGLRYWPANSHLLPHMQLAAGLIKTIRNLQPLYALYSVGSMLTILAAILRIHID